MPQTSIKPRYNPNYKNKTMTEKLKVDSSSILPSNLQSFTQKLLSGNGFVEFK